MRHHHPTRARLKRASLLAAATLAAGTLALSGCSSGAGGDGTGDGASAGPHRGGNVTVRLAQDPGSLDPVFSGNVGTSDIGHEIYQHLVTIDADHKPVPLVAKKIERSDDGLTFTFPLRTGLKFSDGTPLTAKDVVASLTYWVDNDSYAASLKDVLDSITAPDDHTVVVKLTSPYNVPALMGTAEGSAIYKAKVAENAGPKGFGKDGAIGSGPYKLKTWDAGDKIVLERNDDYRSLKTKPSGYAGARHAYLDTITYKVVKDPDAALNGLQTGLWDVTNGTAEQYKQFKRMNGVKVGLTNGVEIQMVYLNHNKESIFSNQKMRDALCYAIDKKAIMAAQGNPELNSGTSAFAAKSDKAMYSTAGENTFEQYDPKKAKKLFAAAGLKPGDTIRMVTTGEFKKFGDALVLIQQDLKKIGIKSTIQQYDFGTMLAKMADPHAWDIVALMQDGFPPVPQYTDLVKGMSKEGYAPAGLKPLIDAYNRASSDAELKKAVDDIQAFTAKHKPTIPLYQSRSYVAYSSRIHGYDHWAELFSNVWVTPKK